MTEPIGGWNPCPPGELGRLAAWLTFRRRLRTAAWAGVGGGPMTDQTQNGWGPCPRGTFGRLTAVLAARRARQVWLTRLGTAVGAVLAVAACWQAAAAVDNWQSGAWQQPAHVCPAPTPCSTGDCPK